MFLDDNTYKNVMKNSIIPTVDILFIKDKCKILLWLRENKPLKWIYYIVGWRIEKGETIIQAAKRKAKEELWLIININNLKFLNVYDDFFNESIYEWVDLQNTTITYVYLLNEKELDGIRTNDSQHEEIKFFDLNDDNINDRVKIRIRDLLASNILK